MDAQQTIELRSGDALIIVDLQNDFLPGGALAVPHGDEVIPKLNRYIEFFSARQLPIIATRDWHPKNHCSFKAQGGLWPEHCVANSTGAAFAKDLKLPPSAMIISKAEAYDDSYSGFGDTDLDRKLREAKVDRVFIGGLATDYCVLATVIDACKNRYQVFFLRDASRAVNVQPEDGAKAEEEMKLSGAVPMNLERIRL